MKQSLQLRVGQQLAMTPQLQQAIRFLQMSTLELKQEIQTTLDSNFMLEEGDEHATEEEANTLEQETDNSLDTSEEPLSPDTLQNLPEDLPVDSSWDDVYEPSVQPTSHSASAEAPELENQDLSTDSLNAHLNAQIDLFPLSETDCAIAIALIDAITPEG
ncbi:MAG TPA: RNA polymerase factor sigma-54, partial [Flavobacteriales bacterium]|nr:RNA polymerase factor sigma-54 [Flavobacteriales bacterium]